MDFYFIAVVINMFWQIFTVLFVLYRFTSFFSMMYNFMLFLGKLLKGVFYIKDKISSFISRRRGYSHIEDEDDDISPRQFSLFSRFRTKRHMNMPLYETRESLVFGQVHSPRTSCSDTDFNRLDIDSRFSYPPPPLPTAPPSSPNVSSSSSYGKSLMFNSHFLTNILQPFSNDSNNTKHTTEQYDDTNNYTHDDNKDLEKALLDKSEDWSI